MTSQKKPTRKAAVKAIPKAGRVQPQAANPTAGKAKNNPGQLAGLETPQANDKLQAKASDTYSATAAQKTQKPVSRTTGQKQRT